MTKWTRVKDGLPEEHETVLIYEGTGPWRYVTIGSYTISRGKHYWYGKEGEDPALGEVTH